MEHPTTAELQQMARDTFGREIERGAGGGLPRPLCPFMVAGSVHLLSSVGGASCAT